MRKIIHKYTNFTNYTNVLFFCFFIFLLLSFLVFLFLSTPDKALAVDWLIEINPPDIVGGGVLSDLPTALSSIFNIIVGVAGGVFVFLLLLGGFRYMTSQGNEEEATKAKKWLTDAIIGIIIVSVAWTAGHWILDQLTKGWSSTGGGGGGITAPSTQPAPTTPSPVTPPPAEPPSGGSNEPPLQVGPDIPVT